MGGLDDYEGAQDKRETNAQRDTENQNESDEMREYGEWVASLFND